MQLITFLIACLESAASMVDPTRAARKVRSNHLSRDCRGTAKGKRVFNKITKLSDTKISEESNKIRVCFLRPGYLANMCMIERAQTFTLSHLTEGLTN